MIPKPVLDHINASYRQSIADLAEFLRIPDISPVKSHAPDVRRAAEWLLRKIRGIGLHGSLYETPGHPVIYAELYANKDAPTLLFYAHYDVAPPGPPEEWITPPFSPVVKDDRIFARGAVDDKGQLFTILRAIEAVLATEGRLPLNVKLLFEGEEEAGSPAMAAFTKAHAQLLKADIVIVIDRPSERRWIPCPSTSAWYWHGPASTHWCTKRGIRRRRPPWPGPRWT